MRVRIRIKAGATAVGMGMMNATVVTFPSDYETDAKKLRSTYQFTYQGKTYRVDQDDAEEI